MQRRKRIGRKYRDMIHVLLIIIILFFYAYYEASLKQHLLPMPAAEAAAPIAEMPVMSHK